MTYTTPPVDLCLDCKGSGRARWKDADGHHEARCCTCGGTGEVPNPVRLMKELAFRLDALESFVHGDGELMEEEEPADHLKIVHL